MSSGSTETFGVRLGWRFSAHRRGYQRQHPTPTHEASGPSDRKKRVRPTRGEKNRAQKARIEALEDDNKQKWSRPDTADPSCFARQQKQHEFTSPSCIARQQEQHSAASQSTRRRVESNVKSWANRTEVQVLEQQLRLSSAELWLRAQVLGVRWRPPLGG